MPSFKLFLVGAVYFDETCMLSLRFGQVPKQTEPPWNRSVSTFHLVCRDILLELRIATAENSGQNQHKNKQNNVLVIGFIVVPLSLPEVVICSLFLHFFILLAFLLTLPSICSHHGHEVWTTEVRERWYEKNPKPTQLEQQFNSHSFI